MYTLCQLALCHWYCMGFLAISEWKCSCWYASSILWTDLVLVCPTDTDWENLYTRHKTITKTITELNRKKQLQTPSPTDHGHWASNFLIAVACAWTSPCLLNDGGLPKACKTSRKKQNDKVKKRIAVFIHVLSLPPHLKPTMDYATCIISPVHCWG